ncbi:hypothetical protein [Roseimicrobium sp. ORNL1]|uniref:hypothetical protein n=1 Tax=Roseimicrobium sp. ORNL1 TaxID=2711231 RepID=UPI0013E1DFD2|nr:hypothetical protein [Roseimicrobium sp. ORNL1]QIF01166.1 hypothetical protein G5S37_06410 [Roseimicrobium sp. ORNL1]
MKIDRASILKNIIHPAMALGLTMSAFAGGNGPVITTGPIERSPDIKLLPRPDLVPLGFTSTRKEQYDTQWHRAYSATVTVANFGTAKSEHFACIFGFKVLATNDPVKYPVGSKGLCGFVTFTEGLDVTEIRDESSTVSFSIPKSVSKIEIYLLVDRYLWGTDDDWENDSGAELTCNIAESNELNNVWGPKVYSFIPLPNTPPVVSW